MLVWIILAIIGAINLLFLAFLIIAGLRKDRRPLTQEEAREEAIELAEQAAALRDWSLRQAAKKARKLKGVH